MNGIFIEILNFSFTASIIALAVMLVRFFLKKMPKLYSYGLWAVVFVRLICPLTFETPVSFSPVEQKLIPQSIVFSETSSIQNEAAVIENAVKNTTKPELSVNIPVNVNVPVNISPIQIMLTFGVYIWILGIFVLLICSAAGYFRLRNRVKTAIRLENNVFETDRIQTPFVLGFIRPKIYLPIGLTGSEFEYILKHEQTHIKRMDYIIKPFAFIITVIHWFNPIVWFSFILMSGDMELSADESVMKQCHKDIRGAYANSLLSMSVKGSGFFSPLAFGETGVKERIKNILKYKKPALWISMGAFIIVCAMSFIFLTSSASGNKIEDEVMAWARSLSVSDVESIETVIKHSDENPRYKNLSRDEFDKIVSLINNSKGTFISQPLKFAESTAFYITTKDGVIHSFSNMSNTYLAIDEKCYSLPDSWFVENFKGYDEPTEPLPDGFWKRINGQSHVIKNLAKELFRNKTPYLGDASKVGGILNNLPSTKLIPTLYGSGMELFTKEPPYGLAFNLNSQDKELAKSLNEKSAKSVFIKNAAVLFSLVDNLEYVRFIITFNGKPGLEIALQRAEIEAVMPEDVRIYAKDEDSFVEFMLTLMNTDYSEMNYENADNFISSSISTFIEKNLNIITSSPREVSNTYAYINIHKKEYDELVKLDNDMLIYSFIQFEQGGQVGLKGNIMAIACQEILSRDKYSGDLDLYYDTGQGWYDSFKEYILQKEKTDKDNEDFKKSKALQTLTWTLDSLRAKPMPDFEYSGEDKLLKQVYDIELQEYQGFKYKGNSFLIIAPYIMGSYKEGDKIKVFTVTNAELYVLYDNEIQQYSGAVIPTAITFKENADGTYEIEKYEKARDGGDYGISIHEFCKMPVSGNEIPGLADKMIKYDQNAVKLLLRENMISHLKSNNLTGIKFRHPDGTFEQLT